MGSEMCIRDSSASSLSASASSFSNKRQQFHILTAKIPRRCRTRRENHQLPTSRRCSGHSLSGSLRYYPPWIIHHQTLRRVQRRLHAVERFRQGGICGGYINSRSDVWKQFMVACEEEETLHYRGSVTSRSRIRRKDSVFDPFLAKVPEGHFHFF